MRKVSLYLFVAFLAIFSACGLKTEDPAPTNTSISITLPSSAPTVAKVGDKIAFTVSATAPNTLSKVEVSKNNTSYDLKSSFTSTSTQYSFNYTVTAGDAGKVLNFRFLVEDIKGNSDAKTYTLNVDAAVNNNTDIRLYNQNAQLVPTGAGSFYVSSSNTVSNSTTATVSAVDITYGIVNGNPSFVSPDAREKNGLSVGGRTGWTKTTFAATTLNFDTVTSRELLAATAPSAELVTVALNGVYIFQNAAGKRGIIKVKKLEKNGLNTADQDVFFDIKIIQ